MVADEMVDKEGGEVIEDVDDVVDKEDGELIEEVDPAGQDDGTTRAPGRLYARKQYSSSSGPPALL